MLLPSWQGAAKEDGRGETMKHIVQFIKKYQAELALLLIVAAFLLVSSMEYHDVTSWQGAH
jgi:hypothetical protein